MGKSEKMDLVNVINEARRARDADLVRYMARILGRQRKAPQGEMGAKPETIVVRVPTVQLSAALRVLDAFSPNITLTISEDTMVVNAHDMCVHIQCARV